MPNKRSPESDTSQETRGGSHQARQESEENIPKGPTAQDSTGEADPALKAVRRFAASSEEGRHPTEIFHAAEKTGRHATDEWKKNKPHPQEGDTPINPS